MTDRHDGLVAVRTVEFDLPVHRWRILFHDGGVIDVLSSCSDSRLNDFAYQTYYGHKARENKAANPPERIVGVTDLGPEKP